MLKKHRLAEAAVELFRNRLYCSEAILQVFNKELGLGLNDAAIKMATGFGSGMGAAKCCCGSLTGAVMVLSAVKGRLNSEENVEEVFALSRELHDRFKNKFRATCCRVLTKNIEWGSPEHHRHCEQYVAGAVSILVDILNKNEKEMVIHETHSVV